MTFWRHVGLLAAKDLRVEFRSREIFYTSSFFAAMVVLISSFAFLREGEIVREVAPGILWVAVAFAGTLGLSRAFDRERESDGMRGLLLSPASRSALFFGKAVGILAFMVAVEFVVVPMIILLYDVPLLRNPGLFLLILVLATFGVAIVGTVFAAMLLRTSSRDVLLPVVLYPILVPLLIASTKGTAALIDLTPNLGAATSALLFIAAYDLVFLVVALWTFESLVIE